jgi:putative sterol carrier protein
VAKYTFLSDEWFAEAQKVIETHGPQQAHAELKMNLVVTDTPFDNDVAMHIKAEDGKGDWGREHLDAADVTLTTDYATAKDIFVSGNPQAGMQAFMSGKVRVQGDMAKLMAAGQGGPGGNPELSEALKEITE